MAEAEYWRFTVARDCQKKNTSENHSGYSLDHQRRSGKPRPSHPGTAGGGALLVVLVPTTLIARPRSCAHTTEAAVTAQLRASSFFGSWWLITRFLGVSPRAPQTSAQQPNGAVPAGAGGVYRRRPRRQLRRPEHLPRDHANRLLRWASQSEHERPRSDPVPCRRLQARQEPRNASENANRDDREVGGALLSEC
jgi:hypothetical protein